MGARMPITTQPRRPRPRASCTIAASGRASPTTCANGWRCRTVARVVPAPDQLLVETFPHDRRPLHGRLQLRGLEREPVARHADHPADGERGLKPLGFVANDYALACYGLEPITDPAALFSPDILADEFVDWVQGSHLLRRAFREVAVIGGLVERQHPGKRKTGRQVTFSTDLIYDVLRRYEPDHLLLEGRLGRCARRG